MKKIFTAMLITATILSVAFCTGCSDSGNTKSGKPKPGEQKQSENYEILVSGKWECETDVCTYMLYLDEDGTFSNYCGCGEPVGDADIVEFYVYDAESGKIYLYDSDEKYISKGKIKVLSEDEIEVSLFGEKCTYVNVKQN